MDLDNAYVPFYLGIGDAIGHTDPVWLEKWKRESGNGSVQEDLTAASLAWENVVCSGSSKHFFALS